MDDAGHPDGAGWLLGPDQPGTIALDSNVTSNRNAPASTAERWRVAADSLWYVLDPLVEQGARAAVVGAGNCYDIPLERLAERCAQLVLVDVDGAAMRHATAALPDELAVRVGCHVEDLTEGAADAIVAAAWADREPDPPEPPRTAIAGGGFDLVVGDLVYGQLLYPGLAAIGLDAERRATLLGEFAPPLTGALVARLHASAPDGIVVHVHDLACWSPTRTQPHPLAAALADPDTIVPQLDCAALNDPVGYLDAADRIEGTWYWHWPFIEGTDMLVRAVVTRPAAPSTTDAPG